MMEWKNLISPHRVGRRRDEPAPLNPARSPFQRDFDRIVFSSAFRRMQDKTQVFPLSGNDYVRTRLTHSLETASIGRSLGSTAGVFLCREFDTGGAHPSDFGAIVAAAALGHDIGNPPLGHGGEAGLGVLEVHPVPLREAIHQEGFIVGISLIDRHPDISL